ncbi:hypothetical protein [Neomoorella glycerini]|uniref:hypothetical protein n=1 Tax=Neomoorella glycerini TaxID=55779 RepID=UPI001FEC7C66|nr:hypothetical protein [Moorella glycerini]
MYNALASLSIRRKESIAVTIRRLLSQAISEEAAVDGKDVITDAVRRAMRDVLKPTEDRLAKLASKAARMAATATYLNTQVIGDLGRRDVLQIYNEARKRAAAYLREQDDEA